MPRKMEAVVDRRKKTDADIAALVSSQLGTKGMALTICMPRPWSCIGVYPHQTSDVVYGIPQTITAKLVYIFLAK